MEKRHFLCRTEGQKYFVHPMCQSQLCSFLHDPLERDLNYDKTNFKNILTALNLLYDNHDISSIYGCFYLLKLSKKIFLSPLRLCPNYFIRFPSRKKHFVRDIIMSVSQGRTHGQHQIMDKISDKNTLSSQDAENAGMVMKIIRKDRLNRRRKKCKEKLSRYRLF